MKRAIAVLPILLMLSACVHAQQSQHIGGSGGVGGLGGVQTTNPPPLQISINSLPAGTLGTAYSQTITVSSGTGPFTFTVLFGSLPPGLSLNSSSGAITGTPTSSGSYTFSIAVLDSTVPTAQSATATFTIDIACPVLTIASTSPLPPGLIATAYSYQFQSTGGLSPRTWSATGVPAGLSLSSAGALTGTPSGSGTSTLVVTVADSCSPNAQLVTGSFDLTVNSAVVIQTTSPLPAGTQGVSYSTQLAAAGGTSPYTWTLSSGTLPTGLSLSSAGIISGTPTTSGTFTFKISVADSATSTNSANYTLIIGCPTLTVTSDPTLPGATQGIAYSDQFLSSGGITPITWAVQSGSSLPSGLSLSSGGALTGTPNLAGAFTFAIRATDSCSSAQTDTLNATLVVTPALQIVTAAALPNGTEGQPYNVQVQAIGGTPPYSWSNPGGTIPNGAEDILDYAAMNVTNRYTSHLSASGLYKGYRLDAGLLWWIKNAQGYPWDGEVVGGDYIKQWFTEMDSSQNAQCQAAGWPNCFNDPQAYKIYRTPVSLWARYHVPGADDVVYTPGPNIYDRTTNCGADSQTGIDNLGVRGELTGPFTDVNWTTTYGGSIPNGTPYLLAQKWIKCTANNILNCTTEEDYWLVKGYGQVRWCTKHLSGGVYVTDQCSVQTTVSAGAATPNFACTVPATNQTNGLPSGVPIASSTALNLKDSTGVISGTPAYQNSFTPIIQVEDSNGLMAQKSMTMTISCPSLSIVTTSPLPNGTQNIAYSFQLQTSGGITPVRWATSGTLPTGMTLSTSGLLSGTPTNFGSFLIGVTATDSCAGVSPNSKQTILALTIAQSTGPLVITTTSPLPNGTQGVAYSTSLAATGGTKPYTWAITVGHLPPGLTLNASTGVVSGTPTAAEVDTPTFQVTDATSATTTKVLSITTSCPTLTMVSTSPLPNGQQGSPYSFQFQASGGISPYTWALTSGSFPAGLSLATTGSLTGTPTANGAFSPTVRVADSCAATPQTASTTFALSVSPAPVPVAITTTSPLPAGTVGVAYSATVSASGGTPPYSWSITAGSLPAGLSLNASTGVISGTPTTSQTTTPTIKATDSLGANASQAFSITISCSTLTITSTSPLPNGTQSSPYSFQFTKTGGQGTVTWTGTSIPTGLSLSTSGLLNGTPSGSGASSLSITATDSCSTPQVANGSFSLTIGAAPNPLAITTASPLSPAVQNQAYSSQMAATGGTPPYGSWTVTVGTLPTGLSLNSSTGVISGTPTVLGTSSFTIRVTDNVAATASKAFTLTVGAATGADNRYCLPNELTTYPGGVTVDGPATLPTNCVRTDLANTPSTGSTTAVASGDASGFQTALNGASCGQTITLVAGSTYTGSFTFPAHSCSGSAWITVRTTGIASLPPEGTRATPCYANVQLTNRPPNPGPGNCPALVSAMAKLKGSGALDETIRIAANADHYRIIGLEIEGKTTTRTVQTQNIINMQVGTGNHIIFDRVWIHGTPDRATVRAALMGDGVSYVAVVDSSATDIHCLTGVCTDSQFFQGGLGTRTKTAFKAVNNYIEVSGTNSMSFGGGGATVMPTDFEFRRNDQYKPWSWNPACVNPLPVSCALPNGTPVFYDLLGPYSVKNQLEVKDIIRALIEGNVMENNWMHADQNAAAILLTPKNQSGNQCPGCIERHITIRYNRIISSGGFLQAVNASADDGGLATEGSHYSIHDNLAENLSYQGVTNVGFNFSTYGMQTWSLPALACGNSFVQHDVSIFHNTLILANGRNYNAMHQMDGPIGACESNMVMRDNVVFYGTQGVNQISNTACAGPTSTNFAAKYTACWTNPFTMTKNVIIAGKGTWPTGNFLPALSSVGFVNYNNGLNGNYALQSTSPYHNAATDGTDIGADMNKLNQAIAGVR